MISYGKQNISQEDIDAVVAVLRSDFLTQGPAVPRFEQAICDYTGAAHAVAVNSGTSALHLACMALGLGSGDWLWTTPITFVASANCGLYCGAQVDFVDIDPDSWNISICRLRERLELAKSRGELPKILVAVHLCGLPCDMEALQELSRQYGFSIIEDASHALGSKYKGEPVGDCVYSDITVFSFHPVKTITTGEGGMATTNCPELAAKMQLLRSHGITRDPDKMTHVADGAWYYQQLDLGYNYRMSDMHAALGVSQLGRLPEFIKGRRRIADQYDKAFNGLPLQVPYRNEQLYSGFHLYVVRLKGGGRDRFYQHMRDHGVGVNIHYIPVHTQPYYKNMGFDYGDYPEAENYYSEAITLPIYPDLKDAEQERVISLVMEAVKS